jgi:hypothetical protein
MTVHRYPLSRLMADYVLGGGGTVAAAGIWSLAPTVPYVMVLFGGLTGLFAIFTIRTAIRQRLRIAADAEGLHMRIIGGWVRSLKWDEVEGVRLRYFSTRRNRQGGWMTLTLRGGGRRMAIDSYVDDFDALIRRAAQAASSRHLALDATTISNFAALKIPLQEGAS